MPATARPGQKQPDPEPLTTGSISTTITNTTPPSAALPSAASATSGGRTTGPDPGLGRPWRVSAGQPGLAFTPAAGSRDGGMEELPRLLANSALSDATSAARRMDASHQPHHSPCDNPANASGPQRWELTRTRNNSRSYRHHRPRCLTHLNGCLTPARAVLYDEPAPRGVTDSSAITIRWYEEEIGTNRTRTDTPKAGRNHRP